MIKHSCAVLVVSFAACLTAFPASAASLSISPSTVTAFPGDVGDSFDVLLTNDGSSAISVAGFAFEVSVTDPDITLTGADFSTVAAPYIFSGDSFVAINGLTLGLDSGQTLDASDLTNDDAGISLAAGQSLALGNVQFNVAAGAAQGNFAVSFTGGSLQNNLSDPSANAIAVDAMSGGDIAITPEPASWLLLAGGLGAWGWRRRTASR